MNLFEHLKGFILAAIVIVAVLGVIVGYRYYRYTQDEPAYCASCHLQNQLLVAYVVKGN